MGSKLLFRMTASLAGTARGSRRQGESWVVSKIRSLLAAGQYWLITARMSWVKQIA